MKLASKRGTALALVIMVSAALLILAAGIVSVAGFNLTYSQNSLESRQAYLDAKSAIEFGKAYVKAHSGSADFSVYKDSGNETGFKVGNAADTNAIATYSKKDMLIKAAGKYKSSDRFRRLGYQFKIGGDTISDFITSGFRYGDNIQIFNSDYKIPDKEFTYPVLMNWDKKALKIVSKINNFSAPQMYFMGTNSSNICLEAKSVNSCSGTTLTSDFFSFNGDIENDKNKNQVFELFLKSESGTGIAYFNNINIKSSYNSQNLNGYYKFTSPLDLFSESVADKMSKIEEKDVDSQLVANNKYVLNNYKNIISGDRIEAESNKKNGVGWVIDGKLSDGIPSKVDNDVFLYVISCGDWIQSTANFKDTFINGSNSTTASIFGANRINLQYVNSSNDFVIPASKTVVFKANNILLNTQVSDTEVGTSGETGTKPLITFENVETGGHANFILQSKNGTDDFYLTCPNKTTVYYYVPKSGDKDKGVYDINPGTYHITSGIGISGTGVNLFTQQAEQHFKGREPDAAINGSAGGVYTDGQ